MERLDYDKRHCRVQRDGQEPLRRARAAVHDYCEKYTKQEVDAFADMFSILVMALEDNSEQDFLGELYMCLGLGSDHAGQFFTPYHLCEFMSAVTTPAEEFQQKIGDRGWVAVCDPTCGAGALLVAFANECRKKASIIRRMYCLWRRTLTTSWV